MGSAIVATLPAAAVFFTAYEWQKSLLTSLAAVPIPLAHGAASAVAELAACAVLAPAEVVKQNAQVQPAPEEQRQRGAWTGSSSSVQALRRLARDGATGSNGGARRRLWTGYTALAARNLPFTAIQFPIFELLRDRFWRLRGKNSDGGPASKGWLESHVDISMKPPDLREVGMVTGGSAAVAGALAAFVTTPSDVVKTRMMLAAGSDSDARRSGTALKSQGGLAVARSIVAEHGTRGLFRGGLLRSVWTALGSGLYLGTYEVSKVWLRRDQDANRGR